MLDVPVVFIIFNRPDTAKQVFAEIAKARPKHLLVIADGPRPDHPEDIHSCAAARRVIEDVNWDCEIKTNYSDVNLGCGVRPATGLDWVFQHYEEAIILEDDCLPNPSFFRYCAILLEKYKNEPRVMAISGNNFQRGVKRGEASYYFSRYPHCWGWATWRRAWRHYDFKMSDWSALKHSFWLKNYVKDRKEATYWEATFDSVYQKNRFDVWDYQWLFACWKSNGLTIIPNLNLVSNIGFSATATHTKDDIYQVANLPAQSMSFPLIEPNKIERNKEADSFTFHKYFSRETYRASIIRRITSKIFHILNTTISSKIT